MHTGIRFRQILELSLSYLPLPFLSNSVKNINPRYKELALPLLSRRMSWLERELAHDMFVNFTDYEFVERRP